MLGRNANAPGNGINNDDNDDDNDDDETGKISELFNAYLRPLFKKDKKWLWWNIGFFVTSVGITHTNGFGFLDWMIPNLTYESPIDKALQTQLPPSAMDLPNQRM